MVVEYEVVRHTMEVDDRSKIRRTGVVLKVVDPPEERRVRVVLDRKGKSTNY